MYQSNPNQINSSVAKNMVPAVGKSGGVNNPGSDRLPLKIQSSKRNRRNLLIDLPIGTRLTLGFIAAALIAAFVSGAIGFQHAQSAGRQSDFYKSLLDGNTRLTTSAQYLQIIKDQIQTIIIALDSQQQSTETLTQDKQALNHVIDLYDQSLKDYTSQDLLTKHPDQQSILASAGRSYQIQDQQTLAGSAIRSWNVQKKSLSDITNYFQPNNPSALAEARYLQQVQVDPTNADALSAVRSLTHFNQQLADSIGVAEQVEARNEVISTAIGSVVAFILIVLVGLLISGTIVRRLTQLRQVTLAVEQGQLNKRVQVIGRDEIADVSASVNAMLEAIVGLLDETRNQRDALTNAAEHLFSDMRVVSAGDLRINAPVSNDPIGMLANAFNFTVGRFRRFVQRTKTTAEQMDVIAHQQIERAENFTQSLLNAKASSSGGQMNVKQQESISGTPPTPAPAQQTTVISQVRHTREHLQQVSQDRILQYTQTVTSLVAQIKVAIERLTTLPNAASALNISPEELRRLYYEEVYTLNGLLTRLTGEAQTVHQAAQQNFKDIDKELGQLAISVRNALAASGDTAAKTPAVGNQQGAMQEVIKQSTSFANDMHAMARQFMALAQEVRTGIVNFQLDTVESGNSLSLPSGKLGRQNPSSPSLTDYQMVPENMQMPINRPGMSSPNRSLSGPSNIWI